MSTPAEVIEETKHKASTKDGKLEILWDAVKALVTGGDLTQARHEFDPEGFAPAPAAEVDLAAQDAEIAALQTQLAAAQKADQIADLQAQVAEAEAPKKSGKS